MEWGVSPQEIFISEEQVVLRPLPKTRWEPTSWSRCTVRREWRIMLGCAYYSVPYPLIGEILELAFRDSSFVLFQEIQTIFPVVI